MAGTAYGGEVTFASPTARATMAQTTGKIWITRCAWSGRTAPWAGNARGGNARLCGAVGVYACRHCHNLAYRTQREQAYDRASSRADLNHKRLGWEPGILNGDGGKPKGMHWRTFERLHAAHEANVQRSLAGIAARFGLAMAR
jgi:hypothetical protein